MTNVSMENASKDIAPHLYSLAHFKRRTVAKELHNNNWIHIVHCISTRQELLQFINLWGLVRNISLSHLESDSSLEVDAKWQVHNSFGIQNTILGLPCPISR
jgi:hypothetical protein